MIDIEKREAAWDAYSQQSIEFTISGAFNAGYEAAAGRWVAVEDREPEPYQSIWVTYDDGTVGNAIESQNIICRNPRYGVVAWMPMVEPEPYRKEK